MSDPMKHPSNFAFRVSVVAKVHNVLPAQVVRRREVERVVHAWPVETLLTRARAECGNGSSGAIKMWPAVSGGSQLDVVGDQ